jgi:mannose-1-phosphate guanylyltransferase
MKAVVLVGGEGTRLRPLTYTRPKQMLPIGGQPMIERVLAWLGGHGVDEAVLSLGYRPDAFLSAYPDGTCAGVKLAYAVEDSPLDTAGAVGFAARSAGLNSTFVVVNGDVLTGLDVSALAAFHRQRAAEATIALTPVADPSAFGVVPTDESGRVIAFIEKPPREEAPTNLINAGTYVLEPSVLDRIPEGRRVSIERETFPQLVGEGRLYAMASEAGWLDAGTPATYLQANLSYAARADTVATGVTVSGSVVGRGVTFGAGSVVSDSVIMDRATVEASAVVRGSIVGYDAKIGRGAHLSELCVIGDGFSVDPEAFLIGERLPPP